MRRAAVFSAIFAVLLAVPALAGGYGTQLEAAVVSVLDRLGVTSGGTYTPPSAGTPTLQEVTTEGATTNKALTLSGAVTIDGQDLTIAGSGHVILKDPTEATMLDLDGGTGHISTAGNLLTGYAVRLYNTANFDLASGSGGTVVTWDSELFDFGSLHDTGSNTERITIPAALDGRVVSVFANVEFVAHATGVRALLVQQFNSSNTMLRYIGFESQPTVSTGDAMLSCGGVTQVSTGDYFRVVCWQTSGTTTADVLGGEDYSSFTLIVH
jgi:hypothetical protein